MIGENTRRHSASKQNDNLRLAAIRSSSCIVSFSPLMVLLDSVSKVTEKLSSMLRNFCSFTYWSGLMAYRWFFP